MTLVRLNKSIKPRNLINYTFGNYCSGDEIIGYKKESYEYPKPQYVEQHIWFPCCGGSNSIPVGFVDIFVEQSTSLGNAYIYSGGIGQDHIEIIIEARRTTYFTYEIQIFGRP